MSILSFRRAARPAPRHSADDPRPAAAAGAAGPDRGGYPCPLPAAGRPPWEFAGISLPGLPEGAAPEVAHEETPPGSHDLTQVIPSPDGPRRYIPQASRERPAPDAPCPIYDHMIATSEAWLPEWKRVHRTVVLASEWDRLVAGWYEHVLPEGQAA